MPPRKSNQFTSGAQSRQSTRHAVASTQTSETTMRVFVVGRSTSQRTGSQGGRRDTGDARTMSRVPRGPYPERVPGAAQSSTNSSACNASGPILYNAGAASPAAVTRRT